MDALQHRVIMPFEHFMRAVCSGAAGNDVYMTAGNAAYNVETVPDLWDDLGPIPEFLQPGDTGRDGMFWIGPAGTVTPNHHDLTNNLVAQLCGRKRFWLVDSSAAACLYNHRHVYSLVDLETIDQARYPLMQQVRVLEVDLAPGDLLFIPVGWWHQVRALDASITMTYTNFLFRNDHHIDYPRN
jgi:ribosomal protein L16 Arg81 hydroxylase